MRKPLFTILLFLIIHSSVFAETSLWKVHSDNSVVYLGGTCHILRQSDYPLPKEFERAYNDADTLFFETDLEGFYKPETQQLIVQKGIYTNGSSLDRILSLETYDVLTQYCDEVGIPVSTLHKFKPSLVVFLLLSLELRRLGINEIGVDLYFYQRATRDGKKTKGLECLEEHIEMVISMGEGNEDDFIMHSIKELKRSKEVINGMIDAWKKGDEKKLGEFFLGQMRKISPLAFSAALR